MTDAHAASRTTHEAFSFCRICSGGCGVRLTISEDNRILAIGPDPDNALSKGYACFKGLQAAESHHGPARLLHPLKRMPDGSYARIQSEQALDEIAEKLQKIVERSGPEALAIFLGNGGMFNIPGYYMHRGFLAAFGSDQYFSTLTIDQSAKYVSFGRLGGWAAGFPAFEQMEVTLLFGANPLLSHGSLGFLQNDPVKNLKLARARGMKLIVVDPRRSETARHADLFLQPYPGEDAAVAGGMIRMILEEGWHDRDFCARWVGQERLENLHRAVEPLTASYVERRAGLEAGQIRAAAQMFARDSKVGSVTVATGTSMAPFSNLAQHLADCLNVICGRFLREGQPVHRINAMGPQGPVHAEAIPPLRSWEEGGPSRIRGARLLYGERPTGTLPDEILTPGKGQIRALLIDGGDPLTSWPDQSKTARALSELELLVAIDPWPTPTTRFAHYILPPYMQYERADLPMLLPGYACWPGGWAQYTAPVIPPPPGSDLVHDWYMFWAIAKRCGKTIVYNGVKALSSELPPTTDELIELVMHGAPITLDELKKHPHGIDVPIGNQTVLPPRAESNGYFEPLPEDVADELRRYLAREHARGHFVRDGQAFTHLLSTRRMRDLFNSNGRFVRTVRRRTPYNPAFLHPSDAAALGLSKGDRIELESAHGRVIAIIDEDEAVKPGVVSIAHGWGAVPGSNEDTAETGSAVNALVDNDRNFEPVNAMPHMSAVPVNIRRLR